MKKVTKKGNNIPLYLPEGLTDIQAKYEPEKFESIVQDFWKQNDYFRRDKDEDGKDKEIYSILMPPPNVTGKLHMGHALDSYYPDTIARLQQMLGKKVVWLAGMDHAGIATQAKVEEKLYKEEGLTREDLGRERFVEKIWEWKDEYANEILKQWDKLGLILPTKKNISKREYKYQFTLDENISKLVKEIFDHYHKEELIYKDDYIVNWDPKLKTSISGIEIVPTQKNPIENIIYLKYLIEGSKDDFIYVRLLEPFTIFDEKAIAIYSRNTDLEKSLNKLYGKRAINPITKKIIPIIDFPLKIPFNKTLRDKQSEIDKKIFGHSIVPSHDEIDFNHWEMYCKNNNKKFEVKNLIDENLIFNFKDNEFNGQNVELVNQKILKKIKSKNFEKCRYTHKHNDPINLIPISQRSGSKTYQMIKKQWFFNVGDLTTNEITKKIVSETIFSPRISDGQITFRSFKKWCISRQLWWGHEINEEDLLKVSKPNIASNDFTPSSKSDVLDTWFSSALLPLLYSEKDSNKKNPTINFLYTGRDLLNFWVFRMLYIAWNFKNSKSTSKPKKVFEEIVIHGLIKDKKGQKMSKSLGNGIDPIEKINQSGSDSLRISLFAKLIPLNDITFDEKSITDYWRVNNKLQNIKSFYSRRIKDINWRDITFKKTSNLQDFHKQMLSKILYFFLEYYHHIIIWKKHDLTNTIKNFRNLLVNNFGNIYIDTINIMNSDQDVYESILVFKELLIVLHPFIPFISEKIYQEFKELLKGKLQFKESILLEELDYVKYAKYYSSFKKQVTLHPNIFKIIKKTKETVNALNRSENINFDEILTTNNTSISYEKSNNILAHWKTTITPIFGKKFDSKKRYELLWDLEDESEYKIIDKPLGDSIFNEGVYDVTERIKLFFIGFKDSKHLPLKLLSKKQLTYESEHQRADKLLNIIKVRIDVVSDKLKRSKALIKSPTFADQKREIKMEIDDIERQLIQHRDFIAKERQKLQKFGYLLETYFPKTKDK